MAFPVLLAVLGAAFLHAFWNALIKRGGDRYRGMFILTLVQGAIGVAVATLHPWPEGAVWYWLMGSGLAHAAYKVFLAIAYEHGDLSRVYPIARGAAPMIVSVIGLFALADHLTSWEYAGILLVGLGIVLMARGVFTDGESRRLLPFALGSAAATAAYSLIDGMGARAAVSAGQYVAWLFIFDLVLFSTVSLVWRGRQVFAGSAREWASGSLAAAASYGAYAIAVWAMTRAPIALVAALRETSILFAVLIGWIAFGERMNAGKALAAALIVAGVLVTRA